MNANNDSIFYAQQDMKIEGTIGSKNNNMIK